MSKYGYLVNNLREHGSTVMTDEAAIVIELLETEVAEMKVAGKELVDGIAIKDDLLKEASRLVNDGRGIAISFMEFLKTLNQHVDVRMKEIDKLKDGEWSDAWDELERIRIMLEKV